MRIRVVKAKEASKRKKVFIQVMAIVVAFLITALFIASLGHNPFKVYYEMINGALGSSYRIQETIIKAIPLLITALGIGVAFKMKFWNIGAEGQIAIGAFCATLVAFRLEGMPKFALLTLMIIAGMIGGGLWALIAGIFKLRFQTNETIVTLMLNYIALKWITYLQFGPWKDPAAQGFPKIARFSDNAILPDVFGVHIGWILALILVILVHLFINYTKRGYEITVLGESENTARYAGMDIKIVVLSAVFISGAIAGLTGVIQASAVNNTLSVQITGGMGYTAIIIAWLSGVSAPWMLVVSILFAVLTQGASYIQTALQIPQSAADIIQSTVLFCVLGSQFFSQYYLQIERTIKIPKNTLEQGGSSHGF